MSDDIRGYNSALDYYQGIVDECVRALDEYEALDAVSDNELPSSKLVASVKRLRRERDEARAAIQWQPIESAPKDGREVLLMVEQRAGIPGKCLVGHWMSGGHCIEDHPPIEAGWYFWNGCMFDKASKPIKWHRMPWS